MDMLRNLMAGIRKRPWLIHVLLLLTYVIFIFYYMTPQVLHCTSTVYGFGDNTAGPIWRYSVSPHSPLWGFEKVTNFPFGENLSNPVNFSGSAQYTTYWMLAKIAGPICGYNLLNFIGFFMSAAIMYGFIYSLTKKKWIAWLAGYLVAFSPYFQVKVGGHPSYGYEALLIGSIWLFLSLLKSQKKKLAIILGLLIALCFYFDPYFVLLESIIIGSLGLTWIAIKFLPAFLHRDKNKRAWSSVWQQFKVLLLAAGVAFIAILPLATIKITKSQQINSYVSSSRGNVLFETRACSNAPYEYVLPFGLHPLFNRVVGTVRYQKIINSLNNHFSCGIGEDSVGLSITALSITALGGIIFFWERLNKRRLKLAKNFSYDPKMLVYGVFLLGLVAVLIGLPPVKYHGIPSPARILLDITSTWRTLARVYVVVNIALVILFSVVIAYFAETFKKNRRILAIVFVVIFCLIAIEYQAFTPLRGNTLYGFDYTKKVPTAYTWLRDQANIHDIVEYPLEKVGSESDAESVYLSMQFIHKKNMLNSMLPNSPQEVIRSSLKNLSDPQTVPTLRTLGVDAVIIHGIPPLEISKIPGLAVVYSAPQSPLNLLGVSPLIHYDNIVIAKILTGQNPAEMIQLGDDGFPRNLNIIHSAVDWQYEALQNSYLNIKPILPDAKQLSTPQDVCFAIRMSLSNDSDMLTLITDGHTNEQVMINGEYQTVQVRAVNTVQLHNTQGHNMQITKLGCPS